MKKLGATPSLKSPSHVSNAPSEAAPVAIAIGMSTQTEAGTGALCSLRLNAVEGTFPLIRGVLISAFERPPTPGTPS